MDINIIIPSVVLFIILWGENHSHMLHIAGGKRDFYRTMKRRFSDTTKRHLYLPGD